MAGPLSVPTYTRPIKPERVLNRLIRLDSIVRPGLSEVEFNRIFAKCHCGLVMTRRVFEGHICMSDIIDLTSDTVDHEVIDLTGDDDI